MIDRHDAPTRTGEPVFMVAIGAFLVTYAASWWRTHSLEWVMVASTAVLGIAIGAGLLVLSLTRDPDHDLASDQGLGQYVDLTLDGDDTDHIGEN